MGSSGPAAFEGYYTLISGGRIGVFVTRGKKKKKRGGTEGEKRAGGGILSYQNFFGGSLAGSRGLSSHIGLSFCG